MFFLKDSVCSEFEIQHMFFLAKCLNSNHVVVVFQDSSGFAISPSGFFKMNLSST